MDFRDCPHSAAINGFSDFTITLTADAKSERSFGLENGAGVNFLSQALGDPFRLSFRTEAAAAFRFRSTKTGA